MAMAASDVARVDLVKTTLRAIGSATVLLLLYYLLPIEHRPHQSVALRLGVGLTFFVAGLAVEIRAISKSGQPMLRAVPAMATVIPLFLVVFSWLYLTMSHSGPGDLRRAADAHELSVLTVTVFSTVGFGDITPKTEVAQLVTTVQMLVDLVVVGVVVRLILTTASRGRARQSTPAP